MINGRCEWVDVDTGGIVANRDPGIISVGRGGFGYKIVTNTGTVVICIDLDTDWIQGVAGSNEGSCTGTRARI
jgi:hypothetical protein